MVKALNRTAMAVMLAVMTVGQARGGDGPGARRTAAPTAPREVSFLNDVEPILTRAGCNQGSCHGSQFGKGGFKLSLAAYDPDFDYVQIVKQAGGRRANRTVPGESLLLKKPALGTAHQGGLKLPRGTGDYLTLMRWIAQGAPGPDPRDPTVTSIRAVPNRVILARGQTVSVRLVARFSDGAERDVTAHTRIGSLNDLVAAATAEGTVTGRGRGATAVMLRYAGLATVTHISVPYSRQAAIPLPWRAGGFVDRAVEKRWRDLGLSPSGPCSDSEFHRRASLDITGTLPAPDEVRAFLSDRSPDRRARLVDRLLDRPEYADYWTLKWSDLLRNSRASLGPRSMWALNGWIRQALSENRPYDQFVRELLTARGGAAATGPANYFRVASTPRDLTETTAQLFLGIRLQCAKCHHHPFEKWSQRDYYQFAAYFARVGVKPSGDGSGEPTVKTLASGEVMHPKTGVTLDPTPLALDDSPRLIGLTPTHAAHVTDDRREALAAWITSPDNLLFAKGMVNRMWGALMGRGIVHPVDDMRVTNPPSNPALLEGLARDFIANGYDVKRLIRTVCTSRAYQLSATPTTANRPDEVFYSHFLPRRLPAEALLDAVSSATGTPEKFPGLPTGTRAIQLPDSSVASAFLDTFGRPARATACECERVSEPTLAQALQLLSGDDVSRKVVSPSGRVAALLKKGASDLEIVDELYLSTVSRKPTAKEKAIAAQAFRAAPRKQAAEDLLWALLNTREFSYVR